MVFAQVILDKTLAMTGRYRSERIVFEGREPLLERLRSGQGAVVVTAHMGCIELCQAMAQRQPGALPSVPWLACSRCRYSSEAARATRRVAQ